jgi:ADP-ribosylglycohydrolase
MPSTSDFILPAFCADALALGPHWVYDTAAIAGWYPGGIMDYDAPRSSYHPGKRAGDFTHYGDQALALLASLNRSGGTLENWQDDWVAWAERAGREKASYIDGATRGTLERMASGRGGASDSADLGGAARIAPLFAWHRDEETLVRLAREQTALTHGDPRVIDAAGFFVRAALRVAEGSDFPAAFAAAAAAGDREALPAGTWLAQAQAAADDGLPGECGPGCGIDGAFPLTLALALKHGDDPVAALSANAMLGGDSAARGLLLGLLLGARHGVGALPRHWPAGLRESVHRELAAATRPAEPV